MSGRQGDWCASLRSAAPYDPRRNRNQKGDYGHSYQYGHGNQAGAGDAGPHAVTQVQKNGGGIDTYAYDDNGNLTGGNTLSAVYDRDNLPWSVQRAGAGFDRFVYAPGNQRIRHRDSRGVTIYYGQGGYEKHYRPGGVVEHRHHLRGTIVSQQGSTRTVTYVHGDRLGSTTALSNAAGQISERRSFDAFGKTRHGNFADRAQGTLDLDPPQTRGFTEHEHLDQTRLIHMNGRSYDYQLGRFLAVDPFIQFPSNSQSLNPYTYILNNPLSGTDPTGYQCRAAIGSHRRSCETVTGTATNAAGEVTGTATARVNAGFMDRLQARAAGGGNGATAPSAAGAARDRKAGNAEVAQAGLPAWSLQNAPMSQVGAGSSAPWDCRSGCHPPRVDQSTGVNLGKVLDGIQLSLDVAGMWPGVGAIPDALSATISVMRGDWLGAGMSGLAAVPILGDIVAASRMADRGADLGGAWRAADGGGAARGVGEYGTVLGHHVHAKRAFEGVAGYDRMKAFAVSDKALAAFGVRHADVTTAQQRLFRALDASGAPNNLTQHTRVAYQALVEAGVPSEAALQMAIQSQSQLIRSGVVEPARIPWGKR